MFRDVPRPDRLADIHVETTENEMAGEEQGAVRELDQARRDDGGSAASVGSPLAVSDSELSRPAWLRYGVAAVVAAVAMAVTAIWWPVFRGAPFMLAFLALFVAGWFGGGGPSVLALLATTAVLLVAPPFTDLRLSDIHDPTRIFLFLGVGAIASLLQFELWATKRARAALTERSDQAYEVAAASRQETERLLEGMGEGFCSLDSDLRYAYANPRAEAILGRPSRALMGLSATETFPLDPEEIRRLRLEPGSRSEYREFFDPRSSRWIEYRAYGVGDRIAILFHDVTERRIAGEMSHRLAAIVESSDDAIVGKSLTGVINAWNPAAERLFGYSAEEILGKQISILMPPDHRHDMENLLSRIRKGERVEHFETVRVTKSGRLVDVSLSVSPVKDAAGHIVGAAKIARDIGERRKNERERERLYREAQETARLREDFLTVAGHELRTPLTAMQLQLHALRKRITDSNPEAMQVLEKIGVQYRRLHQLTEELLDVTRIASGYLLLDPRPADLSGMIREVADRHRETALRSGSEIRVHALEPVTGTWDSSRLDQVATNLISNAVKFGRGMPIEIQVTSSDDGARFTVEDHGIGIAADDQAKIFERFERAVSRRSYGGLGLGLWISRAIVDAHGGRIRVESEPGKGSRFIVDLPFVTVAMRDPDGARLEEAGDPAAAADLSGGEAGERETDDALR